MKTTLENEKKLKNFLFKKLFQNEFEKKIRLAKSIIQNIKSGNLKSRIPIEKYDEAGLLMMEFNNMADEVEEMFLQVKESERSRKILLQDLSHDLKTPLASLRMRVEYMQSENDKMTPEKRLEYLNSIHEDILYTAKMAEELLLLSKVEEVLFKIETSSIDLVKILEEEITQAQMSYSHKGIELKLNFNALEDYTLSADASLIKRLFRNNIENSISFAKSFVAITLSKTENKKIKVSIEDDGPGFPENTHLSYGEKDYTRKFLDKANRTSTGLGAVISRKIVHLHSGEMKANNKKDENSNILGAQISIILPEN